ncbi:unnamed protein product [Amoebophrya sp. A120]|nr:unnamed protein product [Amoebophrya sp. A120]|eukprot:GSA120T00019971001.1
MAVEGFSYLLYAYTEQSRFYLGELTAALARPILYMAVPNTLGAPIRSLDYVVTKRCDNNGNLEYPFLGWQEDFDAQGGWTADCQAARAQGKCCWQRHKYCGIGEDQENCPWRDTEMEDVAFSPAETCPDGSSEKPTELSSSCTHVTVYAKVLNRSKTETTAEYSMIQTTFIVFLLGIGAMMFSKDTQQLVISPIEKMVNIVKQLADDPLSKPSTQSGGYMDDGEDHTSGAAHAAAAQKKQQSSGNSQLETNMLETTILKIGGLLQVGFGEAGAQIIGKNMSSQDGELNILIPGRKIYGIFGFCFIREFTDTTECLLEEVMVFVNKIARIVHICVHEWAGAANKNIGDSFLLTWIVNDLEEQKQMARYGYDKNEKMQDLSDKALISFVKVMAELRRASDLRAYTSHPKIQQKFLNSYEIRMGFGLHCGWAIEGAIGSEHKIDASYLSPHVNLCARLETATDQYGVDILFSEQFHDLLSSKAKDRCRKLDVIMVKGSSKAIGIFTLDLHHTASQSDTGGGGVSGSAASTVLELQAPEGHQCGEVITTGEISKESLVGKLGILFDMDQDLLRMQEGITPEFHTLWKQAFHLYINGAWTPAKEALMRVNAMRMQLQHRADGPSECLLAYMQQLDFCPPEDWQGYRKLESK